MTPFDFWNGFLSKIDGMFKKKIEVISKIEHET